jgi:hypothetical protein
MICRKRLATVVPRRGRSNFARPASYMRSCDRLGEQFRHMLGALVR